MVEIIAGVVVIVVATAIVGGGGWLLKEKLGWFASRSDAETRERLARVEALSG
jgi:hypothetical protein